MPRACKTAVMAAKSLRDVAREFAFGEVSLEALRAAARRTEGGDRQLATVILGIIAEWENTKWRTDSVWAKEELRMRIKDAAPPAPPRSEKPEDPAAAMYADDHEQLPCGWMS